MGTLWKTPPAEAMRSAVKEALRDLGDIEQEVLNNTYTTGARIARADYWGKRAATRKRLAEAEFLTNTGNWKATLHLALQDYLEGIELVERNDHWLLGQYVVLGAVLEDRSLAANGTGGYFEYWKKAMSAATQALENRDPREQMWAWSSIVDLDVVAKAYSWEPPGPIAEQLKVRLQRARAVDGGIKRRPAAKSTLTLHVVPHLEAMISVVGGVTRCEAVWPTFRQFWRWTHWWNGRKWDAEAKAGYAYLYERVKPELLRIDADASAR